ncbi:MAG: polynucleotide adenylyltransferase PcnB [Gammaproteobacteria bacterium]|nr:MAG: polynucleotide adenylyltransferase PcnB [Gammaproteobacteria bacterium]UCH40209.1 MAG: polynucleotide adenylyltransferase PcnB [Gammaproteobacteria bacterium]
MKNREASADHLTVIPRNKHSISRKSISDPALKVLYRLSKSGHRACLVGGGVRDLLLGIHPKDFDVATDATPDQVRALFKNSRIIGRRFRLVHIRFGRDIIEVATFRGHDEDTAETDHHGRILRDNTFGEIEEDAIRRDFTANALYYDIHDHALLDYVGGLQDIEARQLRLIGDPARRYPEDPVRMLRAVRFAAKLDFDIEESAAAAIYEFGHLLAVIPPARMFDEVIKLFHSGSAVRVFELLREYRLLKYLVPALDEWLQGEPPESMLDFIDQALVNTDTRVNTGQPVSPGFIFAVLLWPVVHQQATQMQSDRQKMIPALMQVGETVMKRQVRHVSIPRRFSQMARDIWSSQPRFHRTQGKQPQRLLAHPVFRAAYDFMCIQTMVGLMPHRLCHWWTEFQLKHADSEAPERGKKRRPRRRRRHAG